MNSAVVLPLDQVVEDVSTGNNRVQKGDYLSSGSYPIIDQGQAHIGGYSDDEKNLVSGGGPWIVFGDHTRAIKYVDFPFCMGADGVKVLRPIDEEFVDTKYLYHFLRSNEIPSAGYSRHFKFLKQIAVPIPPPDEQRRIAAILDKADALRRKRKRALHLLDGLTQSIFLGIFGDPSTNPKGLAMGQIGDLLDHVQYGTSGKASEVGTYPILRMGNITNDGKVSIDDLKYIELPGKDVAKFTVRRGDILFNRTNSAELVGKTAVFDRDEMFAFAGYLLRARAKAGIRPEYVSGYLNSRHGKATLRGMAKSIVGMANINAKEMQSIPILVPTEDQQASYARSLESISTGYRRCQVSLTEFNALLASLQHRAFSGQL